MSNFNNVITQRKQKRGTEEQKNKKRELEKKNTRPKSNPIHNYTKCKWTECATERAEIIKMDLKTHTHKPSTCYLQRMPHK